MRAIGQRPVTAVRGRHMGSQKPTSVNWTRPVCGVGVTYVLDAGTSCRHVRRSTTSEEATHRIGSEGFTVQRTVYTPVVLSWYPLAPTVRDRRLRVSSSHLRRSSTYRKS
jgi:hypothetical protein